MLVFRSYVLASLFHAYMQAVVVVDRQYEDVFRRNASIKCSTKKASYESRTTCRCLTRVRTFGSNNPPCVSFVSCRVLRNGVGLITHNNSHQFPIVSNLGTCKIKKVRVKSVEVWNIPSYTNDKNVWKDVSHFALKYFNVSRSEPYRVVANVPFESWQGQLIKVILDCNDACAVIKVKGPITYPFVTSKLGPSKQPFRPAPNNEESGDSLGYIIPVVVVSVIIVAIGVVLLLVCRHKLPCVEDKPMTDDDNELEEPTCSKSTAQEYEELLVTDVNSHGTHNEGSTHEDTNYEGITNYEDTDYEGIPNYEDASNYEDTNYTVPTTTATEPSAGVYYSKIDTLPHEYAPVAPVGDISNPVYTGGAPDAIDLGGNDAVVSYVSTPHYHEVEIDVAAT